MQMDEADLGRHCGMAALLPAVCETRFDGLLAQVGLGEINICGGHRAVITATCAPPTDGCRPSAPRTIGRRLPAL